jgi:hypothetical protein
MKPLLKIVIAIAGTFGPLSHQSNSFRELLLFNFTLQPWSVLPLNICCGKVSPTAPPKNVWQRGKCRPRFADRVCGANHGGLSLRDFDSQSSVLRMKNLKSLQVVALAGIAVALTAGCSSTSSTRVTENSSSDPNAAYRWVSSGGWVPITDIRRVAAFPPGWVPGEFGPVSYETYIMTPPAVGATATGSAAMTSSSSSTTVSTDGSSTTVTTDRPGTTIASNGSTTTITTSDQPEFNESLQPGDTFVEAAGANSDQAGTVRRVILYTPFNSTGIGR